VHPEQQQCIAKLHSVAIVSSVLQVWELVWAKDGFKGFHKAMDLKGHSSQVCTHTTSA